jgi:hypothetical protein
MNSQVAAAISSIKSGCGSDPPVETLTNLGLLVERASLGRYDDPVYEDLGFPIDWLGIRLSDKDLKELLDELVEILDNDELLASTAAWALGKAYSDYVVPHLVHALRKYWRSNDKVAYQLLIGLDNYGKEGAADLIGMIADEGSGKSQEFARRLKGRLERH